MQTYKDLVVWQRAVDLVVAVYDATVSFPQEEQFGLKAQLRRAACSIPSNIAEGEGRRALRDRRRFLLQSRGSLFELETQITIARRLDLIDAAQCTKLETISPSVARPLNGLVRKLDGALAARPAARPASRPTRP